MFDLPEPLSDTPLCLSAHPDRHDWEASPWNHRPFFVKEDEDEFEDEDFFDDEDDDVLEEDDDEDFLDDDEDEDFFDDDDDDDFLDDDDE